MPDLDIFRDDKPKDECGVFGIFGHRKRRISLRKQRAGLPASELTYLGLRGLQHRGQESTGIVASDGKASSYHRGMGLVDSVFDAETLSRLKGHIAIGHNRYATAGNNDLKNAQPLTCKHNGEPLAVAHNGNFVNAQRIRSQLENTGSVFRTTSDTEVILHLLARSAQTDLEDQVIDALRKVHGGYSIVLMDQSTLIGARDPYGFRPLWLGQRDKAYVLASETCALDVIKAKPIREIAPGEMILITSTNQEPRSVRFHPPLPHQSQCIFEHIYLARPDSTVFGGSVSRSRREFGRQLAYECPADADIVIPVPDTATFAALGYSEESGIPFEMGLYRDTYVGRTFMNPKQEIRDLMVEVKLNAIREVLEGKRVVVVDDSIMRGTNCRKLVEMIRAGGAEEVHFRVASAPNKFACFYGVNTPTRKELIASSHTIDEIRESIGADSLGYLSIEGMLRCVKSPSDFCTACFDGNYPKE